MYAVKIIQCPFTGFVIEDRVEPCIEQITAGHAKQFVKRTKEAGMPAREGKAVKVIALVLQHLRRRFVPGLRSGTDQIGTVKEQAGIKVTGKLHQPLVSRIGSYGNTAEL